MPQVFGHSVCDSIVDTQQMPSWAQEKLTLIGKWVIVILYISHPNKGISQSELVLFKLPVPSQNACLSVFYRIYMIRKSCSAFHFLKNMSLKDTVSFHSRDYMKIAVVRQLYSLISVLSSCIHSTDITIQFTWCANLS